MENNLFSYATSELSQDAFFCWLFTFCNNRKETRLREISQNIVRFMLALPGSCVIETIEIIKQERNIDFYIVINNKYVAIFEDKVKTTHHDDQLQKYKNYIVSKYDNHVIISYIYLKTDLVWTNERKEVASYSYKIFDIFGIQSQLPEYKGNDIYNDYFHYLNERIAEYLSYRNAIIDNWNLNIWLGFCYELGNRIGYSFFGKYHSGEVFWLVLLWYESMIDESCTISLEINSRKLVIKMETNNKRNIVKCRNAILSNFQVFINKYKCIIGNRNGKHTTILEVPDFLKLTDKGICDFDKTIEFVTKIKNESKKILDRM